MLRSGKGVDAFMSEKVPMGRKGGKVLGSVLLLSMVRREVEILSSTGTGLTWQLSPKTGG